MASLVLHLYIILHMHIINGTVLNSRAMKIDKQPDSRKLQRAMGLTSDKPRWRKQWHFQVMALSFKDRVLCQTTFVSSLFVFNSHSPPWLPGYFCCGSLLLLSCSFLLWMVYHLVQKYEWMESLNEFRGNCLTYKKSVDRLGGGFLRLQNPRSFLAFCS